jgi:predicted MFS family arabinose efflux permease
MSGRKGGSPILADTKIGIVPSGRSFWLRLLTHRNVIALCLMYLPNTFTFYFCITWFNTYLHEDRGLNDWQLAFFTGLPLLLSVAADALGGVTTDWAVRRFGPRWGRAGVGLASYLTAGTAILLAVFVRDARISATLFAVGTAANMFILGSAWGTCQDIGGSHAGVVSATMNTSGQISSMICSPLVIYLANHYGWNTNLYLIGTAFLVFSLCWLFVDPRKKVFA